MRISVIAPVLQEVAFIGYSVMSVLPYVEEFVYAISPKSNDGTIELLRHIAKNYGQQGGNIRLMIDNRYDFNPLDMKAYNASYDDCIQQARGDAVWFLHPDMIVTKWNEPQEGSLAWTTQLTSYARDLKTVITQGRCDQWKNIHAKKFGLHYYGKYGSGNEDFYHRDITGNSYKHYGTDFKKYPYAIATSGIEVNHYCENKPYKRRLEKMKLCLRSLYPQYTDQRIAEMAAHHPRVTLEESSQQFGRFEFEETTRPIPEVFEKYKEEFEAFDRTKIKEAVYGA